MIMSQNYSVRYLEEGESYYTDHKGNYIEIDKVFTLLFVKNFGKFIFFINNGDDEGLIDLYSPQKCFAKFVEMYSHEDLHTAQKYFPHLKLTHETYGL